APCGRPRRAAMPRGLALRLLGLRLAASLRTGRPRGLLWRAALGLLRRLSGLPGSVLGPRPPRGLPASLVVSGQDPVQEALSVETRCISRPPACCFLYGLRLANRVRPI